MARKIEVVPYDPNWPRMFREEAKKIRRTLGKNCVAVHHIGSTAVKDLKAKPTIDILAVVKDLSQVDAVNQKMEVLGYECMGENGIPGRRFFAKGGDERTHHVHVFEESNESQIQRHLAVVQYLSANEQRREEYAELKTYLAEAYPEDPEGYCEGKAYFVSQLEQEALSHYQQPEEEQEDSTGGQRSIAVSMGMAVGLLLGVTVFHNIGAGLCVGLVIGIIIGFVRSKKNKK